MSMDQDLKVKWVEALRSGKYEQTTGVLESPDGANCCLGVLCRVVGLPKSKDGIIVHYLVDGETWSGSLPEGVAGLTSGRVEQCIKMNDDAQMTFDQIADVIERSF